MSVVEQPEVKIIQSKLEGAILDRLARTQQNLVDADICGISNINLIVRDVDEYLAIERIRANKLEAARNRAQRRINPIDDLGKKLVQQSCAPLVQQDGSEAPKYQP